MTDAIKCDRCREFETPDHGEDTSFKDPRWNMTPKKDLCFDCVQELKEWWRNHP